MNVFKLFAKLSLDAKEYEKGLSDAQSKAGNFVSGVKSVVGKAGDVLATVGKTAAAAIGVASTAVSGLAKKSLDAYADFEQLEGGAKLMFGDAYDFIMQKSAEAYSTVQLSQNAYLEQVNGFAVGLKTALGGNEQAAAELADKIITAEADIVSATGNSQEAVQNAFNGIMKSNYTMLDNLQLGIKPTKEGMEEVIDKVNAWNAANGKATSYMIDNLADVQSALVDYVEMQGLAGYAANEASTTIQGSIAGMKSAWQNFLTGTGTPAQLVKSMKTAAGNVVKQIKVIVPQLVDGLKGLAHELVPEIPGIMHDLLPTVIDGAVSLLTAASEELPGMIDTLLPPLIQGTVMVMSALVQNLPQILQSLANALPVVLTTLMENSGGMIEAGKEMLVMLKDGLVAGVKFISEHSSEIIDGIFDAIANLAMIASNAFEFAGDILSELVDGLLSEKTLNTIVRKAPDVIKAIVNALVTGIGEAIELGVQIIGKLVDYLFGEDANEHWTDLIQAAGKIIQFIWDGIAKLGENLGGYFVGFAKKIADAMGLGKFWEYGAKMISDLWGGVQEGWEKWKHRFELAGEWIYNALHKSTVSAKANEMIEQILVDNGLDPEEVKRQAEQAEIDKTRAENHFGVYATQEDKIERGSNTYLSTGKYEATPENYAARFNVKGIPVFGGGGIVTKPTVALIGEDGAEAVVPLEKDSDVGRRFSGSTFNVTIYNDFHGVDDMQNAGDFVVQKIDEALRRYQLQQVRGQGGTAW